MTAIRNLHWWSVEYGLIGDLRDYKIYGAGLLSSIGESKWCMGAQVAKMPYNISCASQNFDYTKPQPQLFVTPDFAHLSFVLEEFANTMGLRTGGITAVERLIESEKLGTIELSTGIQITGIFSDFIPAANGRVAYFFTNGTTALAFRDRELIGHGTLNHPAGFGSPVGKLKGINIAIEDMSPRDLEAYHIYERRQVKLEFEGHITVEGRVITGIRNLQGKILLIRFDQCLVEHKDKVLFSPDEGIYDMAVGKEIISGYAGPADLNSFDLITHVVTEQAPTRVPDQSQRKLEDCYLKVQALRSGNGDASDLAALVTEVLDYFPDQWLLILELYEVCLQYHALQNAGNLKDHLKALSESSPNIAHLITEGLDFSTA